MTSDMTLLLHNLKFEWHKFIMIKPDYPKECIWSLASRADYLCLYFAYCNLQQKPLDRLLLSKQIISYIYFFKRNNFI